MCRKYLNTSTSDRIHTNARESHHRSLKNFLSLSELGSSATPQLLHCYCEQHCLPTDVGLCIMRTDLYCRYTEKVEPENRAHSGDRVLLCTHTATYMYAFTV